MEGYPIIRIDTGRWRDSPPRITVNFTSGHEDVASDLCSLAEDAGFSTQHGRVSYAVGPGADLASLTTELVAFVGAAGAFAGSPQS